MSLLLDFNMHLYFLLKPACYYCYFVIYSRTIVNNLLILHHFERYQNYQNIIKTIPTKNGLHENKSPFNGFNHWMDISTGHSAMCIRLCVEAGEKTRDIAAQQGGETGSDVEEIQSASQQDILTRNFL